MLLDPGRHQGPHRERERRAALVSRLLRRGDPAELRGAGGEPAARGRASLRGEAGRGAPLAQAVNLGIGRAAYEAALDYAQLRVQGGRPIVEHQAIGGKLAEVAIRLEMARNAIWQAAWASDHPAAQADRSLPDLPLTTVAQVFARSDLPRRQGRRRVLRRHGRDARHAAAEIHHRRAHLPLLRRRRDDAKLRIAEALAGYRRPSLLAAE